MTWEVFYTPHTDDEVIGMGASIAKARAHGHQVCVVLVTDNMPSTRGARLFADVEQNIFQARRKEWRAAMEVFGVARLETWDISEAMLLMNWFAAHDTCTQKILELHRELGSVVAHHTVWGLWDIHCGSGLSSMSHALCANALFRAALIKEMCAVLHGVYVYSLPHELRRAPQILTVQKEWQDLKCAAMRCYQPSESSLGYGFASVPELFTNAEHDPREFLLDISSQT